MAAPEIELGPSPVIDAGAPPVLLDLTVEDEDENEEKANLGEE